MLFSSQNPDLQSKATCGTFAVKMLLLVPLGTPTMLVPLGGEPTWRLHTKLYKFG